MAKRIIIDTQYVKTYASIKNLEKAVADFADFDHRYVVMTTETGRYYALFLSEDVTHVTWHGHAVTN